MQSPVKRTDTTAESLEVLERKLARLQKRLRETQALAKKKAQVEKDLMERLEKYSTAVEQSPDAVLILYDHAFRFASRAVREIYGYAPDEMIGMPSRSTVAAESMNLIDERLSRKAAGLEVPLFYEVRIRRKDGTTRDAEVFTKDVRYEGKAATMAIVRDITARRQAELKIVQRNKELDALYRGLVTIAQTFDLRESLREVCRQVNAATSSAFSYVALPSQDGGQTVIADRLPSKRAAERCLHPTALVAKIVGEANPVVVNDCCIRAGGVLPEECPIRSWAGIPIGVRNAVLGVLFVHSSEPKAFSDGVELLSAFASQAAIAIRNSRLYEAVLAEQTRVQRLLGKVITAQEDERRRLSLDLHDSVAQSMYGVLARIGAAERLSSQLDYEGTRTELAQAKSAVEQTLVDLRRVSIDLHPPALEALGLCEAIRQLSVEFSSMNPEIACTFSTVGLPVRLAGTTEIAAYRITQEALNNIRRHASATRVTIRLSFLRDSVSIVVRDNGRGFDFSTTAKRETLSGHLGLAGMIERAELIGGSLDVRTAAGKGTTVRLTAPLGSSKVT
ncbi:MAG: PAS domain S-box protein [Dehalococcoidia bacterium]|nr:PAS domain S-box protein [Dehalococcoidia bacterium]